MLLIFDFDGTIADSLDAFLAVANTHFKTPITKSEVRLKGTAKLLAELNVPKILLPFFILKARKEISLLMAKLRVFNGVPEVLHKLQKKHELCIVTSNSKQNALTFLKENKITKSFLIVDDSLAYFGKHRKIKKLMNRLKYSPSECFYIGDETRDIIAAKKAGVQSVAVTWGYENKKLLEKAKPDYLAHKSEDLLKLLQEPQLLL